MWASRWWRHAGRPPRAMREGQQPTRSAADGAAYNLPVLPGRAWDGARRVGVSVSAGVAVTVLHEKWTGQTSGGAPPHTPARSLAGPRRPAPLPRGRAVRVHMSRGAAPPSRLGRWRGPAAPRRSLAGARAAVLRPVTSNHPYAR